MIRAPQHRPASDIADLIAKLEKATGPDPHLDAEIEALIRGGVPAYRCSDSTRRSYGPSAVFRRDDGSHILGADWWSAPSHTGSVDVALTLVPEEWAAWEIRSREGRKSFAAEVSRLRDPGNLTYEDRETAYAPTAPLALCIAALRARQAAS